MDGYTYIKNVLDYDNKNIDTLLLKLKKRENSAVEFKASFLPKVGSGDNADACSWNVISAIIALANSAGGCVLLGVDDEGEYADGFLCGEEDLDKYTLKLNDHISNKSKWSYDNKNFWIESESRNQLKGCVEVINGKLSEKDIVVIHVKPAKTPIVYKERKGNEQTPIEYLAYRSKGAIAQKISVPVTLQALQEFLARQTDSSFFDQLWNEYKGNKNVSTQNLWISILSVVAILLTAVQVFFIYYGNDATYKGFDRRFLILLAGLPFFAIVDVFLKFVFNATRRMFLCVFNLCWISFSIASFVYVLRLFNVANEDNYSLGLKILIALLLFVGISVFCFFFMPILIPSEYKKDAKVPEGTPKPDDIVVHHPHFTIEWKCVDGEFWWTNSDIIDTPYGQWKLQRNKFFGNFRILDSRRIMRCYGFQGEVLPEFKKIRDIYDNVRAK